MTTPKIVLTDIAKAFGPHRVLDGVDLAIERGESLTIIGQSGSGKSVMLKCILGLIQPDRGSIRVDGEEMLGLKGRELDRARAKFGMLFQSGALFDSLPVWRNVTFALTQGRTIETARMRKIAQENLERVGLDATVLDLKPIELSGGMQKRVALARAIAPRPEIIFFDEPTTGLDPVLVNTIHQLIKTLHGQHHFTAVMVSHEIPEIFQIADRVAMLHEGRIVEAGPPATIRASTNPVVRRFINGEPE